MERVIGIHHVLPSDPRVVWYRVLMEKSKMQDIHDFYVEVTNLPAFMIRHYSMVNVVAPRTIHT